MGRLISAVVIFCNIILILLSLYSMTRSVDFLLRGDPDCTNALPRRDLVLAIFLFILGLVGIVCVVLKARVLKFLYLLFIAVFVIIIVMITGLVFFGTSREVKNDKGEGKEFALERYSSWLQEYLVNRRYWGALKKCVVDHQVCTRHSSQDSSIKHLQGGCCKPPPYCGFRPIENNLTWVWEPPNSGPPSLERDCITWSNDHDKRCLDCGTCKAAYIENSLSNWYYKATTLFCVSLVLLVFSPCISRDDRGFKAP